MQAHNTHLLTAQTGRPGDSNALFLWLLTCARRFPLFPPNICSVPLTQPLSLRSIKSSHRNFKSIGASILMVLNRDYRHYKILIVCLTSSSALKNIAATNSSRSNRQKQRLIVKPTVKPDPAAIIELIQLQQLPTLILNTSAQKYLKCVFLFKKHLRSIRHLRSRNKIQK